MRRIGFTGTRYGCKPEQIRSMEALVRDLTPPTDDWDQSHHGDCIGADADFHGVATRLGLYIVGHLPIDSTHRARCAFDEMREPLPYMQRNRAIVAESDIMIACPFDMTEQTRGGTWKTIGFTRKAGKPLAIVWPDGSVTKERWP